MLIRIHKVPRRDLLDPSTCSDSMAIPAEHVDVRRTAVANVENEDEKSISDIWDSTSATGRTLSDWCICETRFIKLWKAPAGYDIVCGRLTRRQKTSRPPDVWPEMWQAISKKARDKSVIERAALVERIGLARLRRGLIAGMHGIVSAPVASEGTWTLEHSDSFEKHLEWISDKIPVFTTLQVSEAMKCSITTTITLSSRRAFRFGRP